MKCPKCKEGNLKETESIKGLFVRHKVFRYFCPLCSYDKEKQVPYSLSDSLIEVGKDLEKIGKKMEN
jgi:transposase-like protein|tara:strand:- start:190 stop:390 length:201 start_codon:yes stop_codon:yes gene_type:complete